MKTSAAVIPMVPPTESPASESLSAYGKARSTTQGVPLGAEELRKTHAFWTACNYLMLGMIYRKRSGETVLTLKCPLKI